MVVVNLTGFQYPITLTNGRTFIIPYFEPPRPINIPDEAFGRFGDGIKILQAPLPKVLPQPIQTAVEEPVKAVQEPRGVVVEVDVKKPSEPEEGAKKPLKGIKARKRKTILEQNKGKKYFERQREVNNGIVSENNN